MHFLILWFFLSPILWGAEPIPGVQLPVQVLPYLEPPQFVPDTSRLTPEAAHAVQESLRSAGKRVRPILCYLVAGATGIDYKSAQPLACIAEMAHTASLIHDDVIDQSETRRDKPAVWKMVGVNGAVLLGDWVLAEMVTRALQTGMALPAADILRVIQGMTEGEFVQKHLIEAGQYTDEEREHASFLKTGLLFQWSLKAPLFFQNPPPSREVVLNFEKFGALFSSVFQKRDDLDDIHQPGEINAVFLRASQLQHCSPFTTCFKTSILESAAMQVRQEIQLQVGEMRMRLEEISSWAKGIAEAQNWNGARKEEQGKCLRALHQLVNLLGS